MPKTNPRRIPCSRADVERAKQEVADLVTERMLLVTYYFLKDKLGLDGDEFDFAVQRLQSLFSELEEGRITEADIRQVLKSDYDFIIRRTRK